MSAIPLEDSVERRKLYKIRSSYFNQAKHLNDEFKNLGYDYRGNMLRKGTSPELWANPQQIVLYARLEGMLNFLLDYAKMVKKCFSIAHDKDTTNLN